MNSTYRSRRWRLQVAAIAFAAAALGPSAPRGWAHESDVEHTHDESNIVGNESSSGFHGIELGKFSIRTYHAVSSRKENVSFVLHATVKNDDYKNFERLFERRMNKMRDQVVVATRLVPIEDYDDPEFKKFRRRILLRLRRTLPELPIDDVYVSDFSLTAESL